MRSRWIVLPATVGLVACAIGSGPPAPETTTAPTEPATFTNLYASVIRPRCLPCHADGSGATTGRLDMTTQDVAYANLVNRPAASGACLGKGSLVIPGRPDESLFWATLRTDAPPPCGDRMPLGQSPLAQSEIDLVLAWISAGSKND